jgi:hypothetical protein
MARIFAIFSSGFVGVSTQTSFVLGSIAASTVAILLMSMKVKRKPIASAAILRKYPVRIRVNDCAGTF